MQYSSGPAIMAPLGSATVGPPPTTGFSVESGPPQGPARRQQPLRVADGYSRGGVVSRYLVDPSVQSPFLTQSFEGAAVVRSELAASHDVAAAVSPTVTDVSYAFGRPLVSLPPSRLIDSCVHVHIDSPWIV